MDPFLDQLKLEIRRLEKQIADAEDFLAAAPEGTLTIRTRRTQTSYYRNTIIRKNASPTKIQTNITKDKKLVLQLTEKIVQKKILRAAKSNLSYLQKVSTHYQSTTVDALFTLVSPQYQHVLHLRKEKHIQQTLQQPYSHLRFNPDSHTHETDAHIFVRSKSEQIIVNALYAHGIPFRYEEEFIYEVSVDGVGRVFPDFTIILPNGKRILWEHLGRLDDPEYCQRNALKLCLYQRNGYVIGDNLILTMDDDKGNLSSSLVLQAIEQIKAKLEEEALVPYDRR